MSNVKIFISVEVTSENLSRAGFYGNLRAAHRNCESWIKSITRKLTCAGKSVFTVIVTDVPVDNISFSWSITLEGDFYCEDIDKLNTKLQREYRQRFDNFGDNHIDITECKNQAGDIVVQKQKSHAK